MTLGADVGDGAGPGGRGRWAGVGSEGSSMAGTVGVGSGLANKRMVQSWPSISA